MRFDFKLGAMLAALSQPLGSLQPGLGKQTLDVMFRPQFDITGGQRSHGKRGKHRLSGTIKSAGPRHWTTSWKGIATGHKEAARRFARGERGDDRNWDQRKAWLERNAHVIEKREADQARARGPLGGRNAIIWGRR